MTGSTLAQVLAMTKAEIGITGNADDHLLNQRILNQQAWFCDQWDWSMFKDRWDVPLTTGTQYYAFPNVDIQGTPAVLRLDRPITVQAFWNNRYHDLWYGIGAMEYNVFNPELNLRQNPAQKWMWVGNDQTKFEIWPLPASDHKIRFIGNRRQQAPSIASEIADPSLAIIDLDDLLIAQTVAANYMQEKDRPGWQNKLMLAKGLFETKKSNDPQGLEIFRVGRDMEGELKRRPWPLAVVINH